MQWLASARGGGRPGLVLPVLAVVAVGLVIATALLDSITVARSAGLRSVHFGMPLHWLGQDQGSLDPPLVLRRVAAGTQGAAQNR